MAAEPAAHPVEIDAGIGFSSQGRETRSLAVKKHAGSPPVLPQVDPEHDFVLLAPDDDQEADIPLLAAEVSHERIRDLQFDPLRVPCSAPVPRPSPWQFSLSDCLLALTLASGLATAFAYLPLTVYAGISGFAFLAGLMAASFAPAMPRAVKIAWWVLFATYLVTLVAALIQVCLLPLLQA